MDGELQAIPFGMSTYGPYFGPFALHKFDYENHRFSVSLNVLYNKKKGMNNMREKNIMENLP